MTGFVDAVKSMYSNYANFKGRASRSDYWWPVLFYMIVVYGLTFLGSILGRSVAGILSIVVMIFLLATIIPLIALAARRMHDSDKSGWFQLIPFYNLYLSIIKGTDGSNRFGPDPLGGTGDTFN